MRSDYTQCPAAAALSADFAVFASDDLDGSGDLDGSNDGFDDANVTSTPSQSDDSCKERYDQLKSMIIGFGVALLILLTVLGGLAAFHIHSLRARLAESEAESGEGFCAPSSPGNAKFPHLDLRAAGSMDSDRSSARYTAYAL